MKKNLLYKADISEKTHTSSLSSLEYKFLQEALSVRTLESVRDALEHFLWQSLWAEVLVLYIPPPGPVIFRNNIIAGNNTALCITL